MDSINNYKEWEVAGVQMMLSTKSPTRAVKYVKEKYVDTHPYNELEQIRGRIRTLARRMLMEGVIAPDGTLSVDDFEQMANIETQEEEVIYPEKGWEKSTAGTQHSKMSMKNDI